jgi:hypothetical protein
MNETNTKNYGVLLPIGRVVSDKLYTGYNGVFREKLMPGGNWADDPFTGEFQNKGVEMLSCVSHSENEGYDMVIDWKCKQGLFSVEDIKWLKDKGYFDSNGNFNTSDRYTAKLSGTGKTGNYQFRVEATTYEYGLVPEFLWPQLDGMTWDEYYAEVDEEVIALGKEFAKRFNLNKEAVDNTVEEITSALELSPLQVILYAWNGIDSNGIRYKVENGWNHAVLQLNYKPNNEEYQEILDTYSDWDNTPFVKKLSIDYSMGFRYSFSVVSRTQNNMQFKEKYRYTLVEGDTKRYGFYKNGKLLVGNDLDILNVWIDENGGNITGKTISVKLSDYNSIPHYDLKGNRVPRLDGHGVAIE